METTRASTRSGLSGTQLKMIALVLMVLDHIHYFFSFTGWIPEWFSMLGRLSAPLFMFCMVEGFVHTHDRKRYFLKVYLLSACMSGLLFFMRFGGILRRPDGFFPMNGMMTSFALLMVMYQGVDWLGEKRYLRGLAALVLPVAWPFLANFLSLALPGLATPIGLAAYTVLPMWGSSADAAMETMLLGMALYLFRKNRITQVCVFALCTILYNVVYLGHLLAATQPDFAWSQMFTRYYEWYGAFAGILMLCYHGERGRGYQKFFYAFYPAHIYVLYALSWWVYLLLN